ncbi:nitroreductase/quinone reductase family protein [Streptomyces sp. NPDC056987]|uniref:nitroreductase/quinone reductase family protein n=1 Tax=Streptomyces sp. NPDC056987 TaxID=3345988 RepID=UPI0036257059
MATRNSLMIDELRSTGTTREFGDVIAVLHMVGARSGKPRVTPVAAFPDGDSRYLVGSAAGSPVTPAWVHNLRAHPEIELEVSNGHGGVRTIRAIALELEEPQRTARWQWAMTQWAGFHDIAMRTDRVFPIFRVDRH